MRTVLPPLPIIEVLPALGAALAAHRCAVLEAPPGAGKSTVVPLALLEAGWLGGDRIVMLEPRRLAARAVAERMATTLGEEAGETVGYRTRLATRVGRDTRIEVVTEGVLTRMLQQDPALEGIGCVIFDEFHERSLNADLGLALTLDVQAQLRERLRILAMSATLDGDALARLLGDAPIVRAQGRMFDVETRYAPPPAGRDERLERRVSAAILRALAGHAGDVLAFLPGAGEIRRTAAELEASLGDSDVRIRPLYGELAPERQDAALRPEPDSRRRVVLATNIAETSLTIDGVTIVVDSGYERRQRFDPASGMSALELRRISRGAADQRRGRAGRTAPGICIRLWSETAQATLAPQSPPEIVEADLAPLALELACWGTVDPGALRWLDPPPGAPLAQARDLLARLEAIDPQGRATALGREMAALALHPRLAHMVLRAEAIGRIRLACEIAALLSERDPLRADDPSARDPDLRLRIDVLHGSPAPPGSTVDQPALQRIRRAAGQIERQLARGRRVAAAGRVSGRAEPVAGGAGREPAAAGAARAPASEAHDTGVLLAFAYPDRIGRARAESGGRYLLSGGRGAVLEAPGAIRRNRYIVAAALDLGEREARIRLAAPLDVEDLERHFATSIVRSTEVGWDARQQAVSARRLRRLGALVLDEEPAPGDDAATVAAMIDGIRAAGIGALPWTRELVQWRARIAFARTQDPSGPWPDVSDGALAASLDTWLAPWLGGVTRLAQLGRVDLRVALQSLLSREARRRLDQFAPAELTVPSGSRIAIDYTSGGPTLSVRLQEVFGLAESPRIADGRVAVTMELLSPARRPVQVTRDLASFWSRGYDEVRRELRGRYPKHYWPDDPLQATPTRRVRPRAR